MPFLIANLKMTFRNKQVLFWTLFFPIFMMLIFGSIFQGENRAYEVGIINKSNSQTAKTFVKTLKKVDALKVTQKSENHEKDELEAGNRVAVIIIPKSLADPKKPAPIKIQSKAMGMPSKLPISKPIKIKPVDIKILYNENKAQDANLVSTILSQITGKFNQKISGSVEAIKIKKEAFKSRNLKYIDFLLPGLLAMSLMMGGIVGIATGIATLRERGVLKRLLATPLNPAVFFAVQLVTRLLMALVQAAIMIGIGILAFGAHFYGNIFTLTIVLAFGASVFLVFGLVMASVAKNVETVEPMSRAATMPMLFLGGVFFPIESMPAWLQPISRALPLTYMSDALRQVISEGASLYTIRIDLLVLLVWGIIGFFIASKIFRWE